MGIDPWFKDAKAVGQQLVPRSYTLEHHLGARPGAEHRQVSGFAAALGRTQQQARIDFTIRGQISRDMFGPAKQRVLCQLPVQTLSGLALLAWREGAAGLAQHASKLRTR